MSSSREIVSGRWQGIRFMDRLPVLLSNDPVKIAHLTRDQYHDSIWYSGFTRRCLARLKSIQDWRLIWNGLEINPWSAVCTTSPMHALSIVLHTPYSGWCPIPCHHHQAGQSGGAQQLNTITTTSAAFFLTLLSLPSCLYPLSSYQHFLYHPSFLPASTAD